MLKIDKQIHPESRLSQIQELYNKYASMLFGYINEVVKDPQLAEDHLVKIFCNISNQFDKTNWDEINSWRQLHQFAKNKIAGFSEIPKINGSARASKDRFKPDSGGKYAARLSEDQQKVFCYSYHHGKTLDAISRELNKPVDSIRRLLKEAFIIIRQDCGN